MMDASEQQDGGSGENNEDNDGRQDDDNQRGHAVAGKLFSWGQKSNFGNEGFNVTILDLYRGKPRYIKHYVIANT